MQLFYIDHSPAVKYLGYDRDDSRLRVVFATGGTYDYLGVPREAVQEMLCASRRRQDGCGPSCYFARNIKPKYPCERVQTVESRGVV